MKTGQIDIIPGIDYIFYKSGLKNNAQNSKPRKRTINRANCRGKTLRIKGGMKMGKQKDEMKTEESLKKKKKETEPLPFCTTAASPEHARANDDDEPCDDDRSGT